MKLTLPKLKKLNSLGISHILIPLVAVVIIGGIGSYLLGVNHADAAVPALRCTTSYPSSVTSGSSVKVTQTFTNVGGGTTSAQYGVVDLLVGSYLTVDKIHTASHTIPALVHGQKYSWTATVGPIAGRGGGYASAQYASFTNHKITEDGSVSCTPGTITVKIK